MAGTVLDRPTLWVQPEMDAIDEIHRLPRHEQADAFYYLVNLYYRRLNREHDREFVASYEARRSEAAADVREGLFG